MPIRTTSRFSRFSFAIILAMCFGHRLSAQEASISYDAELQVTPRGKCNQANLLCLEASYQLSPRLSLNAATLSIGRTRQAPLLSDLQDFSNLDADDMLLALSRCEVAYRITERQYLYVGIRNMNGEYFTSPVTSLFTNSSCGIFPTLSFNMDMANYPKASVGLHYSYVAPTFGLQASVYNGQGYDHWTGRENVWRFTPQSDGLFLLAQGDVTRGQAQYFLGSAVLAGQRGGASAKAAVWCYTEQRLTPRLALILDYSHAFGHGLDCTDFVGTGAQYALGRSTIGLFTDYAHFDDDKEWATELTYKFDISDALFVQTSVHLISHHSWQSVGLLRLGVRL